ncbi:hypothetical protein [Actinokineospora globicatena]|uniref:Uncharacterized protein n=1 Tax=Actinokineospora globicatena TaxID=103729 RepID=A0A9W6QV20_9PSEU|nr:hypothetical protein [Actinokineospora globicatena]GLW95129.1 hypothetical protein Aglo03_59450 [Actinokineospora globicatena]
MCASTDSAERELAMYPPSQTVVGSLLALMCGRNTAQPFGFRHIDANYTPVVTQADWEALKACVGTVLKKAQTVQALGDGRWAMGWKSPRTWTLYAWDPRAHSWGVVAVFANGGVFHWQECV